MPESTFRGGCLCGAVRYEINGAPLRFYHCHCGRCRKATGTGHATNLMIKADKIEWLQGEARLNCYKVPEAERFTNCFCDTCGGRMPRYIPELDYVMIPAGSLDHDPGVTPQARIFWDSRAGWSCADEALPVFAEYAK